MIYEFVDVKKRGRPINPPEYMIALLIYGALRHINGTDELAEMAEFHKKFRYVVGDLKPSGRVLRNLYRNMVIYLNNYLPLPLIWLIRWV